MESVEYNVYHIFNGVKKPILEDSSQRLLEGEAFYIAYSITVLKSYMGALSDVDF